MTETTRLYVRGAWLTDSAKLAFNSALNSGHGKSPLLKSSFLRGVLLSVLVDGKRIVV